MLQGATQFPDRDDLWRAGDVVLRRHDGAEAGTIEWIHGVLQQLDFASPKPVPHFDGASVARIDDAVWSAVTFLGGEVIGWSESPSMFDVGAYLARFHDAAATVEVPAQQSPAFPVDQLTGLDDALAAIGHASRPRQLIHGDFTNHNVLAVDGRACGVIDFANSYVEVALADIGFALWRSGRPRQEADEFDPARIAAYMDGYSSVRPLSTDDRAAVIVYLRARGLQIIAKQRARGIRDDGPLRKLAWLDANRKLLG